jgi:hypothetical protein
MVQALNYGNQLVFEQSFIAEFLLAPVNDSTKHLTSLAKSVNAGMAGHGFERPFAAVHFGSVAAGGAGLQLTSFKGSAPTKLGKIDNFNGAMLKLRHP